MIWLILLCAVVGYIAATVAIKILRHRSLNKERIEVGLPTRTLITRRVRA